MMTRTKIIDMLMFEIKKRVTFLPFSPVFSVRNRKKKQKNLSLCISEVIEALGKGKKQTQKSC